MEKCQEVGIDVGLKTRVTAIEKTNGTLLIRASANGMEKLFGADLVVHAAGRIPDLEPLQGSKEFREILEAARVLAPSNVK